jgi:hypothetical protein
MPSQLFHQGGKAWVRLPPLCRIGIALYGVRWQTSLAEALGISDRTVRRWAVADALPDQYRPAVVKLIRDRIRALQGLL